MNKNIFVTLTLAGHLAIGLCTGGCAGDPATVEAQPSQVTGVVEDTQGRPIAGAKVRIENDLTYYDVTTDSDGRYVSPSLPIGGFKAIAWADVSYQGMSYKLRMGMPDPADYDFFSAEEGAVRNFRWQLSGRIPDREASDASGYFGGALELLNGTGSIWDPRLSPGDTVIVTLVPTGPLVDGSAGETLQRSFTMTEGNESYYALDIPAGVYEVTAERQTAGGGGEPLRVGPFSHQELSTTVSFEPSSSYSYESGLGSTGLFLVLNQ